jgi:hypothetical protein
MVFGNGILFENNNMEEKNRIKIVVRQDKKQPPGGCQMIGTGQRAIPALSGVVSGLWPDTWDQAKVKSGQSLAATAVAEVSISQKALKTPKSRAETIVSRRVTNNGQRVTNNGQRVTNDSRQGIKDGRRATKDGRRVTKDG